MKSILATCNFNIEHNCHRIAKNRQIKTNLLTHKIGYTLRHCHDIKSRGLMGEAIQKWGVKLKKDLAYQGKENDN